MPSEGKKRAGRGGMLPEKLLNAGGGTGGKFVYISELIRVGGK